MKIGISSFCWQCFKESGQTKEDYERLKNELRSEVDFEVEVNDENLYEFVCPKGHRAVTQLQEQKFEILLDLAAMALIDGYTREAVSSLTSALERFIEYYIQVISLKNSVSIDDYIKMWKLMSKQSERQLGAYFLLQRLEKGESKWDEKWVGFRNKVIHQGYIPRTNEALDYGEYVLSFIFSTLKELKLNRIEFIQKALLIHLTKNGDKIPENVYRSQGSIPTIINLRSIRTIEFGNVSFKEAIISMKGNSFYKSFYRKSI